VRTDPFLEKRKSKLFLNWRGSCRLARYLIITVVSFALIGCGLERRVNYQYDVEISPNQWLTLKEERGKCWFICEWKGKKVTWPGKTNRDGEAELPITLREHEGNLFMIVLNREDLEAAKYVFFKISESGRHFVEIPPSAFPKQIATQNMLLDPRTRYAIGNHGKIDEWELIRKLDSENGYFLNTPTEQIWIQLETGKNVKTVMLMDSDSRKRIVREYVTKYKPIPLPTLVKEN